MSQINVQGTITTIVGQIDNRAIADRLRPLDAPERWATFTHVVDDGFKMLDFRQGSHTLEALRRENQECMHQLKEEIRRDNETRFRDMQGMLEKMITAATALDGVLAKATSLHIANTIDPKFKDLGKDIKQVITDLDNLKQQIAKQEGEQGLIDKTPLGGAEFEREIAVRCAAWAKANRGTPDHTGPDGQPGDVVITLAKALTGIDLVIVVEAKADEDEVGHTPIRRMLAEAVAARKAQAAVYVTKTAKGLAQVIIGFGENTCPGGQPYIATTADLLDAALSILVMQHRLQVERASLPITDVEAAEKLLKRWRTLLDKFRAHTTNTNTAIEAIRDNPDIAEAVCQEGREIADELARILRAAPGTSEAAG